MAGTDWTQTEIDAAVEAYLFMHRQEQANEKYNKAAINRELRSGPLSDRSRGSIEMRMCNISSVLSNLGSDYIEGYKPRSNVGGTVTAMIEEALQKNSQFVPSGARPPAPKPDANLVLRNRSKYEATNYIRKADPKVDYWVDFSVNPITDYLYRCGDNFNVVIAGNPELEGDFFAIPYSSLKHMLTEATLAKSQDGRRRWIANIVGTELKVTNAEQRLDVSRWYGNPFQLENKIEFLDTTEYNDFAIENRRIEISQRVKQSTFRKRVLENFQHRCCISGVTESDLLIGSHIIPWSHRIETRLDPANGLCLSVLCDAFFDKGYISFANDLTIIVSETIEQLSAATKRSLEAMNGTQATSPSITTINPEFLEYHRENILRKN